MWIYIYIYIYIYIGFPGGTISKENLLAITGDIRDAGLILGLGWSPGGRATPSSVLAWRIPRTEEPDRLQSTGL